MAKRIIIFAKRVVDLWIDHSAPRLGAALAYYTLLSIAPLLAIVLAIVAFPFGRDLARSDTLAEVQQMVGRQAAAFVQSLANDAYQAPPTALGGVAAILILLFGASSVFAELRSALNLIWGTQQSQTSFIRELIKEKLVAFGMTLGLGVVAIVFLGASVGLSVSAKSLARILSVPAPVLNVTNFLVFFSVLSGGICLIFRLIPAKRIAWTDALVGSITTAVLLSLGRIPLDLYLSRARVGSTYGAAGSVVAFLFWVYASAQIFYLGAEFTRVYSEQFGSLSEKFTSKSQT